MHRTGNTLDIQIIKENVEALFKWLRLRLSQSLIMVEHGLLLRNHKQERMLTLLYQKHCYISIYVS